MRNEVDAPGLPRVEFWCLLDLGQGADGRLAHDIVLIRQSHGQRLRHERIGIWGLLFNFGTVSARIGKAEFTFDSVHNPAQVQQDIFTRMDERQDQKREVAAARERARMAEWLAAYHRNVDDFRTEEATQTEED